MSVPPPPGSWIWGVNQWLPGILEIAGKQLRHQKQKHMFNWLWKKKSGHVIAHKDYNQIPDNWKDQFEQTEDEPTHQYKSHNEDAFELQSLRFPSISAAGGDDLGTVAGGDMPSPNFGGFGGGSGGGGGAEGDFGNTDTQAPVEKNPDDPLTTDVVETTDVPSVDTGSTDSGSGSDGN